MAFAIQLTSCASPRRRRGIAIIFEIPASDFPPLQFRERENLWSSIGASLLSRCSYCGSF